jgi:hypothetical protein
VNHQQGGRSILTIVLWLSWLGLLISGLLAVRYMFSADRRAKGLPAPPPVYENVGALDDFPIGVTRLRDGVWIHRSAEAISAIVEKPGCPLFDGGNPPRGLSRSGPSRRSTSGSVGGGCNGPLRRHARDTLLVDLSAKW